MRRQGVNTLRWNCSQTPTYKRHHVDNREQLSPAFFVHIAAFYQGFQSNNVQQHQKLKMPLKVTINMPGPLQVCSSPPLLAANKVSHWKEAARLVSVSLVPELAPDTARKDRRTLTTFRPVILQSALEIIVNMFCMLVRDESDWGGITAAEWGGAAEERRQLNLVSVRPRNVLGLRHCAGHYFRSTIYSRDLVRA